MTQQQQPNSTGQHIALQDQYTPTGHERQPQPAVMLKRIGSTNYRVRVHFSATSRETMNDKILRLAKSEVSE